MAKKKKNTPKKTKQKKGAFKKPSPERRGFFVLSAACILLLSLISFSYEPTTYNLFGKLGHTLGWAFHAVFGLGSYAVCLFFGWIGWRLLFKKPLNSLFLKTLCVIVFVASLGILLALIEDKAHSLRTFLGNTLYGPYWSRKTFMHLGGAPAFYLYKDLPNYNLAATLNTVGVAVLFSASLLTSLLSLAKIHPRSIVTPLYTLFLWICEKCKRPPKKEGSDFLRFVKLKIPGISKDAKNPRNDLLEIKPERNLATRPSLSQKRGNEKTGLKLAWKEPVDEKKMHVVTEPPYQTKKGRINKKAAALAAQRVHNGDFRQYQIPPVSLLTSPKKIDQTSLKKNLRRLAEVLEETLHSFSIEAKVGQINCGPSITSFEVHPAIGVKVQKIKALESDIALNMEAKSIRILAPIPGKAAIGIEVPNPQPQEVAFKEMLSAYQQMGRKYHVPVLLGKTVSGEYVMSDLTKMPHMIIAGATGSGKSVCINTIVMAILMNAKPDEIKLMMIDPKKVELTPYTKLPHMIAPVITEPQGACAALNWLVKEMEDRYNILKQMGMRNIVGFNNRKVNPEFEESLDREIPEQLPYIVAIIDELADLMMVSQNDIETPIARIAQMARAVGIHLILATQRPSREVITGLIKANFPTRVSFKVANRVNSQIVLDENGAESLLGNGDMLFLPPGSSHLVRAQGAFIRDQDINCVIKMICDQAPPNYLIESFDQMEGSDLGLGSSETNKGGDSLYDQAVSVVMESGNASTTFLQRKLKIGYARAAGLIDTLETEGIIGPAAGSKPRKVLTTRGDAFEEELIDS